MPACTCDNAYYRDGKCTECGGDIPADVAAAVKPKRARKGGPHQISVAAATYEKYRERAARENISIAELCDRLVTMELNRKARK